MRVALIQMNPTVGAVEANVSQLLERAHAARAAGAELAVASELVVTGYAPRDLLTRGAFLRQVAQGTRRLMAEAPPELCLVFGTLGVGVPPRALTESDSHSSCLGNDAVALFGGREVARARKRALPNYRVFDEARYFTPGSETTVLEHRDARIALSVCEDAWVGWQLEHGERRYPADPLASVAALDVDLVLTLSASPFTLHKHRQRSEVFAHLARRAAAPLVAVNQVGGNDELIFDGRSQVFDAAGRCRATLPAFEEHTQVVDLAALSASELISAPDEEPTEALLYRALVLGVQDYVRKCGIRSVVLGLSGGIDSALTAAIAVDALGAERVLGLAMPTRYSSEGSLTDARELAERLGVALKVVDIDPLFASYLSVLEPALDGAAAPPPGDVSLENIQARIRGTTVMAFANRLGALALTTGNKSEVAMGYCTLYGDMAGGLAVLSDVTKTWVYRLARYVNRDAVRIPLASITKPPSAELRPGQVDRDSLPAYDLLDRILERVLEGGMGHAELVAGGLPEADVSRVLALLRASEHKRRQAAPGLIVTGADLGLGWRMPVAHGHRDER
ncbi:MAG: NAD+ synthase [Polyangiaceae bacterium]|nr:NAD+ synthase [Polyangiaceae bacterium]MCW5790287.1 NAD+ synthase [Polyangiaceae bacterium]